MKKVQNPRCIVPLVNDSQGHLAYPITSDGAPRELVSNYEPKAVWSSSLGLFTTGLDAD